MPAEADAFVPRVLAFGLGAILFGAPVRALAAPGDAGEPCASLHVEVAPGLAPGWSEAAASLPRELGDALSSSECANVGVTLTAAAPPGSAEVLVRAPDGREASRHVRTPRALLPIVVGLLASAPAEAPPAPVAPALVHALPPDPHEVPDFSPPPPPSPPREDPGHVGVAVGAALGARAGLPTKVLMADLELLAQVLLRDWLIVATVRYAPIGAARGLTPDGDAYDEVGIGLGFGRRLRHGRSSLDLTFVPTLVLVSMETDLPAESSGTLADLRLDACARYGFTVGRSFRFNVALDTDVSPNALARWQVPGPGLLPVPGWTLGLRLGVMADIF